MSDRTAIARAEGLGAAYVSAVRTAVRRDSSAYGFSVTITASYGLVSKVHGDVRLLTIMFFVIGAAAAFIVTEIAVSKFFTREIDSDPGAVVVMASAINLLSIGAAVTASYGLAHLPSSGAWLAGGYGATQVYLVVAGLDVIFARLAARHTEGG